MGRAAQRRETDPVCLSETQSTVHKGGPRRAKGAARGTAHPHTCAGVWEECALRIPRLWLAREMFSTSGLGEGLSRQALGGQDKQRLLRKELDLGGCTVAQPSRAHPSPGATFCAFPGCGSRRPQLWSRHPTGGSQQSRLSEIFRWLQGGSYLSPTFGWAPAQFLPPPRSLLPPRSALGRVRRPRLVACKPASESRRVKREAESQECPVLHTHP